VKAPRFAGIRRRSAFDVARLYLRSAALGFRDRALFSDLRTYVFLIGYPRSGSSLVGSLIDAHRHATVAHELDAVGFLDRGFGRSQLFHLIAANSREFSDSGREWTGYSYEAPGQFQGRSEGIHVIGDKKAGRTTRRLGDDPSLLARLRDTVGVPLRMVHLVRNPYDNIATRHSRRPRSELRETIDRHFALCDAVGTIRGVARQGEILDVRHEDLIGDPAATLTRILAFVGLEPEPEYVRAAAAIVYSSPHRSRDAMEWSDDDRREVAERIARHEFLAGYSWET